MGKEFDKHFERLGGTRFLKRCEVDEVDGIETHVEPWSEKLWKALAELPSLGPAVSTPEPAATGSAIPDPTPAAPPPSAVAAPVEAAAPKAMTLAGDESDPIGSSASNPLLAPVTAARWLSADTSAKDPKRVLHLEIDVSAGGQWICGFEPGDALGVVPTNEPAEVAALLEHMKLEPAGKLDAGNSPPLHLRGTAGASARLRPAPGRDPTLQRALSRPRRPATAR